MPRFFLTPFVIAGLLILPSCSSAEVDTKAAVEEQKQVACNTLGSELTYDKVLMSSKSVSSFNELAKLDSDYTELAQKAYELNLILELSKAGVKSPDTVAKVISLFATIKQFCDS